MAKVFRYPSSLGKYVTSRHTTLCEHKRDGRAGPGGVNERELAPPLARVEKESCSHPLSATAFRRASKCCTSPGENSRADPGDTSVEEVSWVWETVWEQNNWPNPFLALALRWAGPAPGQSIAAELVVVVWVRESWSQWHESGRAGPVPYQLPGAEELVLLLTWAKPKSWPLWHRGRRAGEMTNSDTTQTKIQGLELAHTNIYLI